MSGPSDEKQRVAALLERLGSARSLGHWEFAGGAASVSVPVTAGDDSAVVDITGSLSLVCGSDYVRGSKFALFELGLLSYYDLGYYLVAANLSDIAAMGAQPIGVLTVVRYPPHLSDNEFQEVLAGAQEAATVGGCELLGGDTGGAERLILSGSALGLCEAGTALTRAGSRPGDLLCLSGSVGAPAAALVHFSTRSEQPSTAVSSNDELVLLNSWKRPEPKIRHGRILASQRLATACQDVSDGLRITAEELASASGVRLVIDEGSIPVDGPVETVAREAGLDPLALALGASVDFELLFTVSRPALEKTHEALHEANLELHVIGEATEGSGAFLRRPDGSLAELPGVGWRHQQEDVVSLLRGEASARSGDENDNGDDTPTDD